MNSNPANLLLPRLDGVIDRKNGQYFAICPSHSDRRPSLSVKDTGDTVLIHCFAGCTPREIVNALGLELRDLFPKTNTYHRPSKKTRWNYQDLLQLLEAETTAVYIAACYLEKGWKLSEKDMERLSYSVKRLNQIMEASRSV